MNLKTLDTVIALIIVLLVLSLIVQSLQSLVKKWFKIKSRSILDSLNDLFTYVQLRELELGDATRSAEKIVGGVKEELKKIGRVSFLGKRPMVDSIAKVDLLKILDRLNADSVADLRLSQEELKDKVDKWYETVMQSFEERYTRHMKTVAICISIVVVIFLNANFFNVYKNISTNDTLRAELISRREAVDKQLEEQKQANQSTTTLEQDRAALAKQLEDAGGLGFTPLKWQQVTTFFDGSATYPEGSRAAHAIKTLGGWAIMVMLLSVGAPFWQDALESLFGVKNLLRKKSDTKNVEDKGGQPKP